MALFGHFNNLKIGADVIYQNDYYPFGMQMPGRKGTISGGEYRYAFNGMETDMEVSGNGNSYTTQFRQYDPRLGRWKSLDPLAGKFPNQSPFCAFDNDPIYYTDPLGLEAGDNVDKVKDVKRGGGRRTNARRNRRKSKKYAKKNGVDDYTITYNPETGNPWKDAEFSATVSLTELVDGKKMNSDRIEAMVCFLRTLTDAKYEHLIQEKGISCED